jgi:hypothetical protein
MARPSLPKLLLPACAAALGGCVSLNFGRNVTDEELVLRGEIKAYYNEVAMAFAGGNADALAGLYDEAIARPMTKEQIRAWGADFFAKHGPASFKVDRIEFERVGHVSAVVTIAYRVETKDGQGSFGGSERDELAHRDNRRWYVTAWEKLPDESAGKAIPRSSSSRRD